MEEGRHGIGGGRSWVEEGKQWIEEERRVERRKRGIG